jgi:hypothetical protein
MRVLRAQNPDYEFLVRGDEIHFRDPGMPWKFHGYVTRMRERVTGQIATL